MFDANLVHPGTSCDILQPKELLESRPGRGLNDWRCRARLSDRNDVTSCLFIKLLLTFAYQVVLLSGHLGSSCSTFLRHCVPQGEMMERACLRRFGLRESHSDCLNTSGQICWFWHWFDHAKCFVFNSTSALNTAHVAGQPKWFFLVWHGWHEVCPLPALRIRMLN